MTPAEIESLAKASATALGLHLSEADLAAVSTQLAILFDHARHFSDIDLASDLDPLTVFEP